MRFVRASLLFVVLTGLQFQKCFLWISLPFKKNISHHNRRIQFVALSGNFLCCENLNLRAIAKAMSKRFDYRSFLCFKSSEHVFVFVFCMSSYKHS